MLQRTFCHVQGLGATGEVSLWQQGCRTWQDYLDAPDQFDCGAASAETVKNTLELSQEALADRHHQFFSHRLGLANAWRAWPEFRDSCVYLDIETDGGRNGSSITMIGLYDGTEFTCLTRDQGLGSFPDLISKYAMIVTFFGAGFDLPMLQKKFRKVHFDQIHLDLCPTLRQVGLKGGLKKIEKQVGIARPDEADGLSGLDAIRLYNRFERLGDEKALETLISYNREDVVNLERLAEIAYSRLERVALGSDL